MRRWTARAGLSHVAAFLAVALLSLATIRSNVMQAGEIAGAPTCGMAGMVGASPSHHPASGKAHAACAFCAVAGHLPVCGSATALAPPSVVAWTAWRPRSSLGARGPPAFQPRARGPPSLSLIA